MLRRGRADTMLLHLTLCSAALLLPKSVGQLKASNFPASTRRQLLAAALPVVAVPYAVSAAGGEAASFAYQPALEGKGYGKTQMDNSDFTKLSSGLLIKDVKKGAGSTPEKGDRVVIDWSGYTIGYFGRPFETKQLRSLDGIDEAFLRFEVGAGKVIPALEEGVLGLGAGGVRQIVVVPGALGYPASDPNHDKVGPKPSTFSGQRALNFVLENKELIDKTLLINVKVIRVDKPGQNGWKV